MFRALDGNIELRMRCLLGDLQTGEKPNGIVKKTVVRWIKRQYDELTIGGAETRTLSVALMVERENDLLGDDKSEIGIKSQGRGRFKVT